MVYYLSSLEVLTIINFVPDRCSECNQVKFGIGARIHNIVQK